MRGEHLYVVIFWVGAACNFVMVRSKDDFDSRSRQILVNRDKTHSHCGISLLRRPLMVWNREYDMPSICQAICKYRIILGHPQPAR